MSPARLIVLGSLNMDLVARVERLPAPGETIAAASLETLRGGKGANQALAAARHGAAVAMIGCLGADAQGDAYLHFLWSENIETAGIVSMDAATTGTALIAVDDLGENQIIYCAGANGLLSPEAVRSQANLIGGAALLLTQLESPLACVLEAIRIANEAGLQVVLNASPWRADFPFGQCRVDTLLVNEGEAAALFKMPAADFYAQPADATSKALAALGLGQVVITRGSRSTLCLGVFERFASPALPVYCVVDTVGAGDAFAGVLAARLAEGAPLPEAVRFANAAGALAVQKNGAQGSIPTREQVERCAEGY